MVTEFTLSNGLKCIVAQRKAAPVVSCHIYADVGSFDEVDGQTGIAHLLEHLSFKGSPRLGTTDYIKEAALLDAVDDAFYELKQYLSSSSSSSSSSTAKLKALQQSFQQAQSQASKLEIPNAYGAFLSKEGAVGLNATTTHDSTKYYVNLPANKLELWFALESDRFQCPVFRSLYTEKQVVLEERKLRVDSSPLGPFMESFAEASLANNYRRPVIGYKEDIEGIGRREVGEFFKRHYGPGNMTVAIVGDVSPDQVRQYAEKYFGSWEKNKDNSKRRGEEVEDEDERLPIPKQAVNTRKGLEYIDKSRAGPAMLLAYYRPSVKSTADALPLDVVSDLLTGGRTSRLEKQLVLPGTAVSVSSVATFPGDKHPTQFLLYGIPSPGRSLGDVERGMRGVVEELGEDGPTDEEMRRYKKAAKVQLLSALGSNAGLAAALGSYQGLLGSWRGLAEDLGKIEEMKRGDVMRVVEKYLVTDNCFRGYVAPLD